MKLARKSKKHIEPRTSTLAVTIALIALIGLLAGCGAGSDESASPSSLPFEETPTTVADSPVTTAPAQEATGEPTDTEPQLTSEMFEGMLESDAGRSLLISSIAAETGIELEAAECLLDALPVEILVEAAGSFLGGELDGGFFSPDQVTQLSPLLDSCGIPVDALVS